MTRDGPVRARYVLVSPYPSARRNGVTTYIEHVNAFLVEYGLEPVCIYNDDRLRRADYQTLVRDTVTARFRPEEVLVEAPEVGCPTLLLPPGYRVHVRLHCPRRGQPLA